MLAVPRHAAGVTLMTLLLLGEPAAVGQANSAWMNPPRPLDDPVVPETKALAGSAQAPASIELASSHQLSRAQVARDFAVRYLDLWSASNRVTLASTSSFYAATVTFHGRLRA